MLERKLELAEALKTCSPSSSKSSSVSPNDRGPAYSYSSKVRTRSEPFSPLVTFEHRPGHFTGSPNEIISAVIRITRKVPREQPVDELPARPAPRGFLSRIATRVLCAGDNWCKDLRVIRMPRREYQRFHKRDLQGNYVGTEPERSWDDEMIHEAYGRYQALPLRSVLA